MSANFWSASGIVEILGNAEIRPDATVYSSLKLRGGAARAQILNNVFVGRNGHLHVNLGKPVEFLGFRIGDKSVAYAVISAGEIAEDVQEIEKSRKTLRFWGLSLILLSIVLCWTILVPAIAMVPALVALKNYRAMPTGSEMKQRISAHLETMVSSPAPLAMGGQA